MAVKGMDVEAGRQAATGITNGAEQLRQLTQQMTATVEGFAWNGPDADHTRENWRNQYVTSLHNTAQVLDDFAALINNQAQEQENVSNA